MIVTVTHVVMAAILLSQKLKPMVSFETSVLEIQLADLAPAIDVEPEPTEPLDESEATIVAETPPPATQIEPRPAAPQEPAPEAEPQPAEPQTQTVLTQLDTAPAGLAPAPTSAAAIDAPTGETTGEAVMPAQVASALGQMNCLKLKRHEEGSCPPPDPFEVAIASAERDIPPERLFGDPRYISKTVSDKIFEKEAANRFLWPDEDLFTDPMAPGAYNARRIRNGQEPLWSQEMRDGFSKSE